MEESGVICLGHYLTNALNTHGMIIENFSGGTRNKFLLVREVERNFAPEFTSYGYSLGNCAVQLPSLSLIHSE